MAVVVNPALMAAAQQQAQGDKLILEPLRRSGATRARSARPLDLSASGADALLAGLVKRGVVREAGGGSYWLDETALARSHAATTRVALILLAFLLSAGASLAALLLR